MEFKDKVTKCDYVQVILNLNKYKTFCVWSLNYKDKVKSKRRLAYLFLRKMHLTRFLSIPHIDSPDFKSKLNCKWIKDCL